MRVVYDTNILISAILSQRSSLFHCLQLAIYRIVQAVIFLEILDEFPEKLLVDAQLSRAIAIWIISTFGVKSVAKALRLVCGMPLYFAIFEAAKAL